MRSFAPANISLGVHWHHFNNPILPPLIEPNHQETEHQANKILVYMPFDETDEIVDCLSSVNGYDFYIYCSASLPKDEGNIHLRPFSHHGFLADQASCSGIISNAGFELLSEAIQGGKKLLVQPLKGQMEQISNALALEKLGFGEVMHSHDTPTLRRWLAKPNPDPRPYPNVAGEIVKWFEGGMKQDHAGLAQRLWGQYMQQVVGYPDDSAELA